MPIDPTDPTDPIKPDNAQREDAPAAREPSAPDTHLSRWNGVDLPVGMIALRMPARPIVDADHPERVHATALGVYAFARRLRAGGGN